MSKKSHGNRAILRRPYEHRANLDRTAPVTPNRSICDWPIRPVGISIWGQSSCARPKTELGIGNHAVGVWGVTTRKDDGKMRSGCVDVQTCKMRMLMRRLKTIVDRLGSGPNLVCWLRSGVWVMCQFSNLCIKNALLLLLLVTSMCTDFHHFRSSWWSRHSKSSTFKFSRCSDPSAVSRTRHMSHR